MLNLLDGRQLSRDEAEVLASNLTIGETYFFREAKAIQTLRDHILPEIIRAKRAVNNRWIRIWSAGCSSGEEPYTVAMLLDELVPDLKNWHITISGTDINPRSLAKAKKGLYREWSFRETPPATKQKYFEKVEGTQHWKINDKIKNMVTFSYHNLAADPYPALSNNTNAMDIILCRNALMYFAPGPLRHVLHNFEHCLVEEGWLIVSAAEAPGAGLSQFQALDFSQFTAFKKASRRAEEPPHEIEAPKPAGDLPEPDHDADDPLPYKSSQPEAKAASPAATYDELVSLYLDGRYEAITDLCSSRAPTDAPSLIITARAFANQGLLSEASSWGEKALAADKNNPNGYYLQATISQEQGDLQKAEHLLRNCLYLDESFVLAHFSLGSIALEKKDPAGAARHFGSALKFLRSYESDEILPESEGISSSRLSMIISSLLEVETT